ncbi:MAG: hypothetical protein AAGJ95_10830 [Cyanobacteria bacterium J06554_11]
MVNPTANNPTAELTDKTATELAAMIRDRTVSSREVVESYLAR